MAKAAAASRSGRSWFWLQGMVCGGVAAIAPGTALVVVVLTAPGLTSYAMDREPGRPLARAMLLMAAASVVMPLRSLWEQGGTLEAALNVMADPACPLLSWGAAGLAWLLGQVTEFTTKMILDAQVAFQLRQLNAERDALTAEWTDSLAEARPAPR